MMTVITLKCGTQIALTELEDANLSYVPCGCVDGEEKPLLKFAHLWGHRTRATRKTYGKKFNGFTLSEMTGVQLMTGFPTYRLSAHDGNYLYYTSIDIERRMLERYPDAVAQIQRLYCGNVEGTPCRLATKSGGLRLDAYTPYVGKKMSFKDDDGKMLFEILAFKCLARIDHRYEMLEGSLLEMPTLPKETLQEIYHIIAEIATEEQSDEKPRQVVETSQLGDLEIEWDSNSRSQLFPTEHCQRTSHRSNRDEVRFTRHPDGSVDGKCFNCGESWWEIPPKERLRRSTLKITEDVTDTHVRLQENQAAIIDAFTQALVDDTDADTPHYLILHFEMGSGKNHAFLTTLATLGKRGIGIFENHEQVDEQVHKAFNDFGLRAMGFRGRGYKFEESGLSALPVNMRHLMTDLFDKFKVMCGFYDQILKHQRKGLGAYEYCLGCPFIETCPYLRQFQSAAEMDFLALCMPDLFFDPGLAAFLQRIWRRDEETEAEELIGAALGVKTETRMEFDLGVIDEVVAYILYLSYPYVFADFEALATAWEGEALGDFMTEVLRCLRTDDTDPLSAIKASLLTIDDDTKGLINQQMTQIPKRVCLEAHTIRDKETHEVLSEYYVVDHAENEWVIPVSPNAEQILRRKKVPTLAYQKHLPRGKIGVSPYSLLRTGDITVSEIKGRLWSNGWTFLDQIEKAVKLDIQWIGTKYNTNGEQVCCDTFTLTIPPQVNPIVKRLVLMGGTVDVENTEQAFAGQRVKITVEEGKTAEYAPGVQTYQFTDGRITHQSVFEYDTDDEGKTIYDPETNAPKVIEIKPTALKDLQHYCTLAERHIAEGNLKPVFISYKDFTQPPIADLPLVQRMHECLQVKHFDLTRGLNFQGVKPFIAYGYPKSARPDVVKQNVETLHHANPPTDYTYQRSNENTVGYEAQNIGKYQDPRVEAVRQQLTRDKSKQAVFRARPTRWPDTFTLHHCAEPIPGWTERATGFIRADFYRAQRFEEIGAMIAEREALTAENTIEDFQRVYDCGREKARQLWHEAGGKEHKEDTDTQLLEQILKMKAEGIGERKIASKLGISYGKVRSLLKNAEVH